MGNLFSATKPILVTGATGLLGEAVTKVLLKAGQHVRAMTRNFQRAQGLSELGAEVVLADMTDPSSLDRALRGCQGVFHFAGALADEYASSAYFHQVNVEGTLHLAQAALASGVELFLHTSTAWVYGREAGAGTTERSPYRFSQDYYIDTKIEAERGLQQLCRDGLPLVIIQPSQVYGPKDRHWTLTPLRLIQSGQMILVNGGSGLIQPIFVDDVVAGIIAAAQRGRIGEVYLLCGLEAISMSRYYGEFGKMLGRESFPSLPGWLAMATASLLEKLSAFTKKRPMFTVADVRGNIMHASYSGSKAQDELGFLPQVSLDDGMARVAAWLAKEKPLG